jgi:hypothetical protein
MYAFNEYEQAYLVIEEMVARDGRSSAHDQFIADKGAFLLRQMEAGIAELVGFAIRGAIRDAQQPPAQNVIPPVRSQPRPSAWQTFLGNLVKLLIWLIGLPASFLLTTFFTGWETGHSLARYRLLCCGFWFGSPGGDYCSPLPQSVAPCCTSCKSYRSNSFRRKGLWSLATGNYRQICRCASTQTCFTGQPRTRFLVS